MPAQKRKSAFFGAMREGQTADQPPAEKETDITTPEATPTVVAAPVEAAPELPVPKPTKPKPALIGRGGQATFYLLPIHIPKIDRLCLEYFERTGNRINRNDVARFVFDKIDLNTLLREYADFEKKLQEATNE